MFARVAGAGSLYATLGVDPAADETTIRRAYKKLALQLHPDRNKHEGAEEAFKKVVAAHERLVDPQQRRAYDSTLRRPLMPVHVPAAASNTAAMASMAADAAAFARRCVERVRAADAVVQQLQQPAAIGFGAAQPQPLQFKSGFQFDAINLVPSRPQPDM